jgi:diguanylate cyclase (GGDEF)-like protein
MSEANLFNREEGVIARGEELLEAGALPEEAARGYALLLGDYKKLFSQVRRLVRISDMMQKELNALNRKLEDLSCQDGLTCIPNRRRLDEMLVIEWRRAARGGHGLAAVMIDIDQFKAFNDTYGHGPGDDCLRSVAEVLTRSLRRPAEFVARYGGEEFLALLPETGLRGAAILAERMREGVEVLNIPHEGSPLGRVTISLGVAAVAEPDHDASPKILLRAADEMLYKAKEAGRNRVHAE